MMINEVQSTDAKNMHKDSWNFINNITGCKSAKQGIIKGNSREDRVKEWYDHFSNLLGQTPNEEINSNDDLPKELHDLGMMGDFTAEDVAKAKKQLREGKKGGADSIPPEVLCKNDIILSFANTLLNENVKPE